MASRPTPLQPVPNIPPRPGTRPPDAADPLYPPQLPSTNAISGDDAPPSYEDAMADEITPADGPRREYSGITDVNAPGMDEKEQAPRYSAQQGNPGPGRGGGRGGLV